MKNIASLLVILLCISVLAFGNVIREVCGQWSKWTRCKHSIRSRFLPCIRAGKQFNHTNTQSCHCTNPTTSKWTTNKLNTNDWTISKKPRQTTEGELCGEWSDYSKCQGELCSEGSRIKYMVCVLNGKKSTRTASQACEMPCISTPTYTTEVGPPSPNICKHLPMNKGTQYLQYAPNCHLYYECVPTYSSFRIFIRDCGPTYWKQEYLTCDHTPPTDGSCDPSVTSRPNSRPERNRDECYLQTYPHDDHYFWTGSNSTLQRCPSGTVFYKKLCGCIHEKKNAKCKSDTMLDFTYNEHFDDVSCNHANSILYGDRSGATIQTDGKNTYACFAGKTHFEVPLFRRWFNGNHLRRFTVAFWYKSNAPEANVGLLHNGNCDKKEGFQISTKHGIVYTSTTSRYLKSSTFSKVKSENAWHHLTMIYDGKNLLLYIDGIFDNSLDAHGGLLNTDAPLTIGKLCQSNYLIGCIDELKLFSRSLNISEIMKLAGIRT